MIAGVVARPILRSQLHMLTMHSRLLSSFQALIPTSDLVLTGWVGLRCQQWRKKKCPQNVHLRIIKPHLSFRTNHVRRFLATASQANNDNTAWTWNVGEVAQRYSQQRSLQVVLVSPQIPGNTGCIARTCAATCVGLHLVEPLGFKIDNSKLKRAGLDYWPYVVVKVHSSWTDFFAYFQQQEGEKRLLAFTKHGKHVHTDVKYRPGDWLLFGSEVDGLPPAALDECHCGPYAGGTVRLPMNDTFVRSLNLSVSAGVGVYEALRQLDAENNYSSLDVSPSDSLDQSMLMFVGNSEYNDGFP
ncbi:unnamed protein product [Sphagnum jensenii]|uniref:tRNA/rRNA methyltransferase SpoU type domain-containing protein n=1 Tax=Sphagnum jensenii TaxID=128206 RepID=A0ABP1B1U4_9BRYO